MRIGKVDLNQDVLIIAEVGNNHEGSFTHAQELVGLAADAGVQAVKFQTFRTEHFVSPKDEARFKRLKSFELTFEQFGKLAQQAKEAGLMFISTPLDLESARFLNGIVECFKIASGDNTFYPLLSAVADTGKAVILSSGLMDLSQLKHSVAQIQNHWKSRKIQQELAVLHCVSAYPVPANEANLGAIATLKKELGLTIGYSDHCLGTTAALLSVGLGARIVEEHFTSDKNYSEFRDHQLSADPKEMKELVQRIREANLMLGSGEKKPQPTELQAAQLMRRSVVSTRALEAGHIVQLEDLTWLRPGTGLAPGNESLLVGKRVREFVPAGTYLSVDQVEP
jgi:sialic acid synthase SpsE